MSATNRRSDEAGFTIVYTNNTRFDKQSKKRIRAHAATWSRAHGSKRVPKRPKEPLPVRVKDRKIFPSTAPKKIKREDSDSPIESSTAQAAKIPASPTLSTVLVSGSKFDAFQALPQFPLEEARPDALSVAKRHMPTVLGDWFSHPNIPLNAAQSNAMYVGSLLVTYARHCALTRKKVGPDLLELKGEVIKIVSNSIGKARDGIDLESLYAVFVLSTPVVCLTTTQLPSSNTARKSLFAAQQAASPAAVEDSLAQEIALRDHLLHRQTVIRILLEMGPTKLRQTKNGRHFLAFFILLGNFASLVSSSRPVFTELDLHPSPRIDDKVKTSAIWHSPLYCPLGTYIGAKSPRNSTEASIVELCRNVQSWLSTFDGDGGESGGEHMLAFRQHCRRSIELLEPYAAVSSVLESGYVYECCRIVAYLMLRAEAFQCSLKEAAHGTTCLMEIDNALQKTNLLNLWDSQIGLLYWVLLVSCISVAGSSFNLSQTNILLNGLIGKIATSDYHVGVGLRPLQKLQWFKDLCHCKVKR